MDDKNQYAGINRRQDVRTKLVARVKLVSPNVGEFDVRSGDISDSGVYLYSLGHELPEIGSVVKLQVQDLPGGDAPIIEAKIVRRDAQGIGLRFLTGTDSNSEHQE